MAGRKHFNPVQVLFCVIVVMVILWASPAFLKAAEAAYAPDLFISEYIEGSGENKALEIYNGTAEEVNLSGYKIQIYYDGETSPGYTLPLSGLLASNGTYVISHSQASRALKDKADIYVKNLNFDGDDVIVLKRSSPDEVVDAIGKIGVRYPSGSYLTIGDLTLVRKSSVGQGDSDPNDSFDPTLEWDAYSVDTFVYLGGHTWSDYGVKEVSHLAVAAGEDYLRLTWTEPDDPGFARAIIFYKEAGADAYNVAGEVYRGTDSYTIINLNTGTTYNIRVVAEDNNGNRSSGVEISGIPQDTVPPAVIEKTPPEGATDVPVDAEISAAFDEDIAEGLWFNDIAIQDEAGNVVGSVYGVLDGRNLAIAHSDFAYNTLYTVVVPAGAVVDEVYNESSSVDWSFTTAALPPVAGTVYLKGPGEVTGGLPFNVKVQIGNSSNFYGAQVKLTYDATKLRLLDADEASPGIPAAAGDVFSGVSPVYKQEILNRAEQDGASGLLVYAAAVTERVYGVTGAGPYSFVEVHFQPLEGANQAEITLDTDFTRLAQTPDSNSFQIVPDWEVTKLNIRIVDIISDEPEDDPEDELDETAGPAPDEDEDEEGWSSRRGDSRQAGAETGRFASGQQVVQGGQATVIYSPDGGIAVIFPAGALPEGAFLALTTARGGRVEKGMPGKPQAFFRLEAVDHEGERIALSKVPFQINLKLTALLETAAESDIVCLCFDPVYEEWVPVFLERPEGGRIIAATARRFGSYALVKTEPPYFDGFSLAAWYGPAVTRLAEKNLLGGFFGGNFQPYEPLTRGEAAKLIALAFQVPGVKEEAGFSDTQKHRARTFINSLAKAGLVKGYPARSFYPDHFITRAEFATLVVRSLEGKTLHETNCGLSPLFRDLEADLWVAPFISRAVCQGLVRGYPDGTFRPGEYITRAEAAILLDNALPLYRVC